MQAMVAPLVSGKLGRPTPSYTSSPSPDAYPGRASASQAGSRSMVLIGSDGGRQCLWIWGRVVTGTGRTSTAHWQTACPPFLHASRKAGSFTSTHSPSQGAHGDELSSYPRTSPYLPSIHHPATRRPAVHILRARRAPGEPLSARMRARSLRHLACALHAPARRRLYLPLRCRRAHCMMLWSSRRSVLSLRWRKSSPRACWR